MAMNYVCEISVTHFPVTIYEACITFFICEVGKPRITFARTAGRTIVVRESSGCLSPPHQLHRVLPLIPVTNVIQEKSEHFNSKQPDEHAKLINVKNVCSLFRTLKIICFFKSLSALFLKRVMLTR